MVDVKHIGIISDEMREVVEELWPELGTQAAAEGVGSYFLSPRTINARKAGPWPLRQDAERLSRVHIHRETWHSAHMKFQFWLSFVQCSTLSCLISSSGWRWNHRCPPCS